MKKIKVFGQSSCGGCLDLLRILKQKKASYVYYDIKTPEGLAALAEAGLLEEEVVPIITDLDNKELNLDIYLEGLLNV